MPPEMGSGATLPKREVERRGHKSQQAEDERGRLHVPLAMSPLGIAALFHDLEFRKRQRYCYATAMLQPCFTT